MSNEDFVRERFPQCTCCFSTDYNKFKIYKDSRTWVALSASFLSAREAWADAAVAIRARDASRDEQASSVDSDNIP